jgi:protein TonB
MWSLHASAGHSASILGVGHFTVPADVTPSASSETESSSTVRHIVVPHDIVAVPRRSPIKARTRTPWHPAQAPVVVERGGSREWFTDRLFVESKQANLPAACSTSAMVHVVIVLVVLLLFAARIVRADLMPRAHMDVSLRMPALESVMPVTIAPPPARPQVERASPVPPAPPIARTLETTTAAPLDTPARVEPEPATLHEAPVEGAVGEGQAGGTTDGVTGGVAGATGNGPAVEPAVPPAAAGLFRAGEGIERPRKMKHVKPVYPVQAQSARIGGNVLIEATIGVDGKVRDARVVQSIALLDQAALDAVRQWEFEPSRVNGVAVAVTMVIVVSFALL